MLPTVIPPWPVKNSSIHTVFARTRQRRHPLGQETAERRVGRADQVGAGDLSRQRAHAAPCGDRPCGCVRVGRVRLALGHRVPCGPSPSLLFRKRTPNVFQRYAFQRTTTTPGRCKGRRGQAGPRGRGRARHQGGRKGLRSACRIVTGTEITLAISSDLAHTRRATLFYVDLLSPFKRRSVLRLRPTTPGCRTDAGNRYLGDYDNGQWHSKMVQRNQRLRLHRT